MRRRRYQLVLSRLLFCVCVLGTFVCRAQSEHPEVTRTRGFPEYKKQKKLIESEREKGYELHLERLEMEKREYEDALAEYRKQKRKEKPLEYTPAYKEKLVERHQEKGQREEDLQDFRAEKKIEKKQLEQAHLNKMEELGLPEDRPRFDLKKRVLYGATSPFGKSKGLGKGSFGGSESGGSGGMGYTPPPASFDEFPPPPPSVFPEDNFDLPPPPPPMPTFDDGMGSNSAIPFDDFPPPPPPPPMEDFQF